MGTPTGRAQGKDRQQHAGANSRWEWVVAAIGLALVLACIGYLALLQVRGGTEQVDPRLHVTAIERQGERHVVHLRVTNAGEGAATALRVTGRLLRGAEVVEEKEAEFEHLPGRSSREAALFFREDPRRFELRLSAESYLEP